MKGDSGKTQLISGMIVNKGESLELDFYGIYSLLRARIYLLLATLKTKHVINSLTFEMFDDIINHPIIQKRNEVYSLCDASLVKTDIYLQVKDANDRYYDRVNKLYKDHPMNRFTDESEMTEVMLLLNECSCGVRCMESNLRKIILLNGMPVALLLADYINILSKYLHLMIILEEEAAAKTNK